MPDHERPARSTRFIVFLLAPAEAPWGPVGPARGLRPPEGFFAFLNLWIFEFSQFKVQGLDIRILLGAEGPQQGPQGPRGPEGPPALRRS